MSVLATNRQDDQPVDLAEWTGLAVRVLEAEGAGGELSLAFVDETAMAELNQRFRGQEGSTDVLAFPIDEPLGAGDQHRDRGAEQPLMLGDVVVCPAVAARNATFHGHPPEDEMALLVVHGILHLQGLDHRDQAEASAMEERERQLLAHCRAPAPPTTPAP